MAQVFAPAIPSVDSALDALVTARFASRLFAHDATLWGSAAEAEAAIRLGWTDFAARASALIAEVTELREQFAARGVDHVVLCGMGGSSLAPLVIAPHLTVLDSTHPDAVREAISTDLSRTAVVVSSKSGGTVETLSHRASFTQAFTDAGIDPAQRIVVVTDPGSALETSARDAGQRVFLADPNVGGRFSVLTAFGIVPSVLAGADVDSIVAAASAAREALSIDSPENPALQLAASIAAGLPEQYILEVVSDGSVPASLGLWIEQLIAESTGKDGKGVLPISHPVLPAELGAPADIARRVVVSLAGQETIGGALTVAAPLGAQFIVWETATAALGHLMGIDPFNQPDVEAAKVAARENLGSEVELSPTTPAPTGAALVEALRAILPVHGYIAIQAFADAQHDGAAGRLELLRDRLATELAAPVALGWGPRYLHSTGQLHKGGPASAAFLQFVELAKTDLSIPGNDASYGELIAAQAVGDATVLRSRDRNVITIVTPDLPQLLKKLLDS